ncbi:FtsX-like permease family protein [Kutzneria albida]|uniref:FtsX-like permease family protein n=1 Tax=Kutzneria albida TaxID=43357 RepID=UPI001F377442|nr:FtsX-like permease family protein [Kutzneria albida]
MNPVTVLRLGLSEYRSHPGRALLPGLALLVGVACLVASLVLGDAMVRAVSDGSERTPALIGLTVERDTRADQPGDLGAAAAKLGGTPGVRRVVPVRTTEVDLLDANGRAGQQRSEAAIDPGDDSLRRYTLAQGKAPAADGEIAVDRVTAYQRGLHPGSTVAMADAAGHPFEVTVSGITQRGSMGGESFLIVGPQLAGKLNPKATTTEVDLQVDPGTTAAAVQPVVGAGLRVFSADHKADRSGAGTLGTLLMLFSLLALATSVFVAGATFRAVYLQRQRQTALLRCVGADRGPLVAANLVEALLTGALAGVAGALLGGPFAQLLGWVLDVTGVSPMMGAVQLEPALLPSPGHVIVGVIVACVLSGAAALRPAIAAARVSPLAALRTAEHATPDTKLARRRVVRGLLLLGVAGVLALGALATTRSVASPFFALFSAIACTAGLFGSLGPTVVPALGRVFGSVAGRLFGTHARLASAELGRVPARAAAVAMPLVLASAIVAFTVVTTSSMRDFAIKTDSRPRPDVVVSDTGDRPLPGQVLNAVRQPQVRASAVLGQVTQEVTMPGGRRGPNRVTVAGGDPAALADYLGKPVPGADSALVSSWLPVAEGDRITLDGLPGGSRTVTVAALVPNELLGGNGVVLGDPNLAPASSVLVALRPDADPAAYRDAVTAALAGAPTVQVKTAADHSAELQRNMDLATVALMVLLSLSVAVAVTGIGTALTISVRERRKELALRRALGVTRGGVLLGIIAEAVLLSLVGLVGGGVLGLEYGELLMAGVGVYVLPSAQLAPLLVGGAVVVALAVLTSVFPARLAARVRPAAGLASG